MTIQYDAGPERRKLASALAEQLAAKAIYAGMPSAQYEVGDYIISRESTLIGPDNRELIDTLRQQGFLPTEEAYAEPEAPAEPGAVEAERPECLAIEIPIADLTPEAVDRLRKLVDSKAVLLKMALKVTDLPIEIEQDRLHFPWFPSDGNADAYAQLVTALCRTAEEKQRINARPQNEYPNPRFTMRCWLTTTLGLVGDDYRKIRRLLCAIPGNSAWSRGSDPRKAAKAEVVENRED